MRYRVCLIANTFGSAAACSTNLYGRREQIVGMVDKTSPSRCGEDALRVSRSPNADGVAGTKGGSLQRGTIHPYTCHRAEGPTSPAPAHVSRIDVGFAQKQFEHVLRSCRRRLRGEREIQAPPGKFALERLEEVFAVFLDLHVPRCG